jgi:hypothetical protein
LQELQVDLLQVPHAEPAEVTGFSTPLIPKRENFFFTSKEPHEGHFTSLLPETSSSNSSEQAVHVYS